MTATIEFEHDISDIIIHICVNSTYNVLLSSINRVVLFFKVPQTNINKVYHVHTYIEVH